MPVLQLLRAQIRSSQILNCLFLTHLISFYVCPSYAQILPKYISEAPTVNHAVRNGENFSRDFTTALGVAVAVVTMGTALICVFAHCWRQLLDWGWGTKRSVARKRKYKDEEAWFCGADRGLPMPQFDILEPESEPLALSMQTLERDGTPESVYGHYALAAHARNAVPSARTRSKARWNNPGTKLPSWLDPEEIERPASVAYSLDRP
ncbi:hypothetical protein FHL15_001679 [Xylaria flabelliformis]|uniref:Uncharacterized protein n=1 Tax=Xylaria flabelliformis TaxID=2512241 RepID=A0A553IB22_9PEZI|nr:hypothetical protein FHL15_001679 [Xylaria flabelliformis]